MCGILAGCGSTASGRPTPLATATPTASPDPATLTYVNAWRDAYNAMRAAAQFAESCAGTALTSGSERDLLACKDPFEKLVAAATALKVQLNATTPPARWQTQHAALLQAVQTMIDLHMADLGFIAQQDVASFLGTRDRAHAMFQSFCAPLRQLNDGPPPLAPKLVVPDPGQCPTANG